MGYSQSVWLKGVEYVLEYDVKTTLPSSQQATDTLARLHAGVKSDFIDRISRLDEGDEQDS